MPTCAVYLVKSAVSTFELAVDGTELSSPFVAGRAPLKSQARDRSGRAVWRARNPRKRAAERLRACGRGRLSEFVDRYVFAPPSAGEATEYFEQLALGEE
jgi:hypothetical protein